MRVNSGLSKCTFHITFMSPCSCCNPVIILYGLPVVNVIMIMFPHSGYVCIPTCSGSCSDSHVVTVSCFCSYGPMLTMQCSRRFPHVFIFMWSHSEIHAQVPILVFACACAMRMLAFTFMCVSVCMLCICYE